MRLHDGESSSDISFPPPPPELNTDRLEALKRSTNLFQLYLPAHDIETHPDLMFNEPENMMKDIKQGTTAAQLPAVVGVERHLRTSSDSQPDEPKLKSETISFRTFARSTSTESPSEYFLNSTLLTPSSSSTSTNTPNSLHDNIQPNQQHRGAYKMTNGAHNGHGPNVMNCSVSDQSTVSITDFPSDIPVVPLSFGTSLNPSKESNISSRLSETCSPPSVLMSTRDFLYDVPANTVYEIATNGHSKLTSTESERMPPPPMMPPPPPKRIPSINNGNNGFSSSNSSYGYATIQHNGRVKRNDEHNGSAHK